MGLSVPWVSFHFKNPQKKMGEIFTIVMGQTGHGKAMGIRGRRLTGSWAPALSLPSHTIFGKSPKLLKLIGNVKIIEMINSNTTWRREGGTV